MTTSAVRIKILALAAIIATALFLISRVLGPGGASLPPANATTSTPVDGITVSAVGTSSGTPDALRLSMSVQATAADVSTALAEANSAAQAVFAALKKDGVKPADLQTSNMSIQTNYTQKGAPDGYVVSESLTAVLRDLGTAGAVITRAASAGGNAARVDGVSLDLSDSSSLVKAARDKAFAEAKLKAEQYASAAGVPLGTVRSITETVEQPNFAYATAAGASRDMASVPIEAGSKDVQVTVTVVFAIG